MITPRQRLFFQFASVEYEGIPYMTPQDFLESVTENHPRRKENNFFLFHFIFIDDFLYFTKTLKHIFYCKN